MTSPDSQQSRRPVPTLIHDGRAWVEAIHYDQARTDADYAENAHRENETLRVRCEYLDSIAEVLDRGIPDDRKLAVITRLVYVAAQTPKETR